MAVECPVTDHCLNCGERCVICIGNYEQAEWESAELCELGLHYVHKQGAPEHPYREWKKRRRQEAREAERDRKRTPAYKKKSRTVKRALKTEEKTRRAVVRATKRSGALNGDGDSRVGDGSIGIEDKTQSNATRQFTVVVDELEKAHRQGCIMVVTTATGAKFVVSELTFFCENLESLQQLVIHD